MSILSRPAVASTAGRLLQATTVLAHRRTAARAHARLPEFGRRMQELMIPTSVGPARTTVYRNPDVIGTGTEPVHVNVHGGGFIFAETEIDDPLCRALAVQTESVILNVDYVVAPKHRFPVAAHQVDEVVRWVAAHGAENGWDGSKLTVGGDSAGGSLSAAAARLAFERGGDPVIALQVLHYPAVDLAMDPRQKHSPLEKPLLRPWLREIFDISYVGPDTDRTDRLLSPANAADTVDLTGIAPALIIAAENDVLRDEAKRYADRLAAVGALVEYREVAGKDHGYDAFDDDAARTTYAFIAEHIRRAMGTA
ncbi:alpha/beta hydrolase [Tersicoccus sp. MR15.9]|uniref:alpha/beta hydrolase n=1 Tax=Tersicoccus mangrovi TaxID=3121635 RepID=UPI002FE5DE38